MDADITHPDRRRAQDARVIDKVTRKETQGLIYLGSLGKLRKYASKLATFFSSPTPQNLMFVPGTTLLGELMNFVKDCSVQTMPDFFIASE